MITKEREGHKCVCVCEMYDGDRGDGALNGPTVCAYQGFAEVRLQYDWYRAAGVSDWSVAQRCVFSFVSVVCFCFCLNHSTIIHWGAKHPSNMDQWSSSYFLA